jgi:hypothetical protein
MSTITAERLRQLLHYDPERGVFTWLSRPAERSWNTRFAGTRAGTINGLGYVVIGILGRRYKAHRLAWLYVHGEWPGRELDHINCDKSDNRIANLRPATRSQNIARIKPPLACASYGRRQASHRPFRHPRSRSRRLHRRRREAFRRICKG